MFPHVFADLDEFLELPRVEGLELSPDGRRLVVGVAAPDRERNRFTTALWEVDPDGTRPAHRLTHSTEGESSPSFTPDGNLLFVSARPDTSLWLQPARAGDAFVVAKPPGEARGLVVSASGAVVFGSAPVNAERAAAGISAILHEDFPIRYWDHDLGPERTRLYVSENASSDFTDLTGDAGAALDDECTWDISPDGRTVVAMWSVAEPGGSRRHTVVEIDVATGKRRMLADDPDHEYEEPRVSPDGTRVAVIVQERCTPTDPGHRFLGVVEDGRFRDLTGNWDRRPLSVRWTPDGDALVVTADDHGRMPVWHVDAGTGEVTRLTPDHGAYTDIRISPDGQWIYALRSAIDSPPAPVRIALDGTMESLKGPAEVPVIPGLLEEVTTTAVDGTALRAWIAVPHKASADSPAPLLLNPHGGPLMSSKSWHWRWNPWILVARGYAVLLPDYALSTGYGTDFIRRGWGKYGDAPYTDLMAITDAAQRRPDIDAGRAAVTGASFGGYLANWIAGHTDRFAAIVTHASIWDLERSADAADLAYVLHRQRPPQDNSPCRFADEITTPMLVIHGDKDYRVPVGEALRLWWDLCSRSKAADGPGPHKFLHFPDEGHFIRKPHNIKIFYDTMLAFLDHHVRGDQWRRPELLG
jgi:dipeptidyl aminopeptidase/acylaminoacyl peptidase